MTYYLKIGKSRLVRIENQPDFICAGRQVYVQFAFGNRVKATFVQGKRFDRLTNKHKRNYTIRFIDPFNLIAGMYDGHIDRYLTKVKEEAENRKNEQLNHLIEIDQNLRGRFLNVQ